MGIDATSFATSGSYLKKEDLDGDVKVTIQGAKEVELEGRRRLAVKFVEFPKPLLCNVTNARVLVDGFGKDTDGWKGKTITLFVDPNVEFGGKREGGLRLRADEASFPHAFRGAHRFRQ